MFDKGYESGIRTVIEQIEHFNCPDIPCLLKCLKRVKFFLETGIRKEIDCMEKTN